MSGSSGSSGGEALHLPPALDRPTLHVGAWLEAGLPAKRLPDEVSAWLAAQGAEVASARRLKVSFHATYLAELAAPWRGAERVIVQVLGCELGDKAVFHLATPCSRDLVASACELAAAAGVRVPRCFGGAAASCHGTALDFVVWEFIATETVEDEVCAPGPEWQRICREVVAQLRARPVPSAEALPRFASAGALAGYLRSLTADPGLLACCDRAAELAPGAGEPVLTHQDLNDGNLLCSRAPGGGWHLDALIDWEAACVVPPELTGRDVALLHATCLAVKGAWLAARVREGSAPRCEIEELVEGYTRASEALAKAGWREHVPWLDLL